jgi:predicted small lipoprotein YifL
MKKYLSALGIAAAAAMLASCGGSGPEPANTAVTDLNVNDGFETETSFGNDATFDNSLDTLSPIDGNGSNQLAPDNATLAPQ